MCRYFRAGFTVHCADVCNQFTQCTVNFLHKQNVRLFDNLCFQDPNDIMIETNEWLLPVACLVMLRPSHASICIVNHFSDQLHSSTGSVTAHGERSAAA